MTVTNKRISHNSHTWMLLLLLSAFALRAYRIASVPFGWHPDEATKALLARDVIAGKFFPVFFSAFTGREALYVYLEAGIFLLLGERIFAARLLSVFIGLITVALTYATVKTLFNRNVALFTAAFLSFSLWHLIASRNGYRAVLQPLVQLPALLFLWRGLREERGVIRNFLVAGLWLGLTQYTYTAARFFPLLVVAIVLAATAIVPRTIVQRKKPLALAVVASVVVFLPLGLHFLNHPDDFYGRAAQVSVFSAQWSGGEPWLRLWQSVKESARMFTVWGDINYRFNVAGQPVFGNLDGALFYLGIVVALWRSARSRGLRRLAYVTAVLWGTIMLLPMTLSADSLPYFQRAIGILPVVYVFPALALDVGIKGVHSLVERARTLPERLPGAATAGALLLFGFLLARVAGDYFNDWHRAPRNDDDRRTAMVYVADYLRDTGAVDNLYLSTQYVQHPTLALMAPQIYDEIQWFDAAQSLPLPPAGRPANYIFLLENRPQPLLMQQIPQMEPHRTGFDRFGRPVFQVYQWEGAWQWPTAPRQGPVAWSWEVTFPEDDPLGARNTIGLPVNFGSVMEFTGHYRSADSPAAGETLEMVLYWRLMAKPERPYTIFAHLLNAGGQVVAGYDANHYPTAFWQEGGGEALLSYFPLDIPSDVPPGVYQVEIGVYHQPTGERLPVLKEGQMVADRLLLAPVTVR